MEFINISNIESYMSETIFIKDCEITTSAVKTYCDGHQYSITYILILQLILNFILISVCVFNPEFKLYLKNELTNIIYINLAFTIIILARLWLL